jgi:hypothetical protein
MPFYMNSWIKTRNSARYEIWAELNSCGLCYKCIFIYTDIKRYVNALFSNVVIDHRVILFIIYYNRPSIIVPFACNFASKIWITKRQGLCAILVSEISDRFLSAIVWKCVDFTKRLFIQTKLNCTFTFF